MDPTTTGLTILGGAIGGAKVVEKILGPTADYVGAGLKDWADRRVQNGPSTSRRAAEPIPVLAVLFGSWCCAFLFALADAFRTRIEPKVRKAP